MPAVAFPASNGSDAGRSLLPAIPESVVTGSPDVRLTRAEYWLLLKAATMRLPLWVIAAPEGPPWGVGTIEESLNCLGHGLSHGALACTVQRLARRKWIRLYRSSRCGEHREPLQADRHVIAAEFDRQRCEDGIGTYELTPLGGEVFEAFARPEWDRYIEDFFLLSAVDGESAERQIIAADRRRLNRYLDAVRHEYEVDPGSESIHERTDWQPIYWKAPRAGVECRLRYRDRQPTHESSIRSAGSLLRSWCEWGG